MPAHTTSVTQSIKRNQFLITGDLQGVVHVRDINQGYNRILEADPNNFMTQKTPKRQNVKITALELLTLPQGYPIVLAGDAAGQISLITSQPDSQGGEQTVMKTFGAANDLPNHNSAPIISIFCIPS